uniref:Arabinogalactan protein 1-like n=1 Tax=Castor canadensis TaxID=51338 RepID=A0A8B7W6D4_CASCN|nr:arabinogalactan protein 1-like [Castor canadensis]
MTCTRSKQRRKAQLDSSQSRISSACSAKNYRCPSWAPGSSTGARAWLELTTLPGLPPAQAPETRTCHSLQGRAPTPNLSPDPAPPRPRAQCPTPEAGTPEQGPRRLSFPRVGAQPAPSSTSIVSHTMAPLTKVPAAATAATTAESSAQPSVPPAPAASSSSVLDS